MAYATMVWGFADITISTNLARDLGTRIVAAIFYGGEGTVLAHTVRPDKQLTFCSLFLSQLLLDFHPRQRPGNDIRDGILRVPDA